MAFNIAGNLLATNWGQQAGQNIRQARQEARELEQQNMLAQALPMAISGDQNALAQVYAVNPTVGYRIQSDMQEQKALSAKAKREQVESQRGHFLDAAVGALASVSQMPEAQREAAWRAQEDDLMRRFPDFVDQEPDTWETARTVAPRLAAADKKYGEILGRYGLIPNEQKAPPLENWQNADGTINPTLFEAEKGLRQAGAASNVTYGAPMTVLDANGNPVLVQPGNRGGVLPVPGFKPAPSAAATKDPTEDQNKSYGFYQNAKNSLNDLNSALKEDPNAWKPSVTAEALEGVPFVGETAANAQLTPAQQRYRQAIYTIADMSLRAETGANAPEPEVWRKVKQLTPRPGDDAGTRAQKQKAIEVIVDTLKVRAGRALPANEVPSSGAANADVPPDIAAILQKHGKK